MNRYKLFQRQAIVMLSVLLLSLTLVTPAFADEAPPLPAPTEDAAPAADTSSEAAAEGQESTPPSETEASESAPPEQSVAEILEQLPADTELVIVDENGEALPLASEAAEEAIVLKDPIWCPVGVAPKPGIGGCSNSFVSLSALVAGFIPPAKNGVIWIEAGTDTGSQVVINGAGTWAPAANNSLTLQGGWVGGLTGNAAIVGTTVFDTAISIVNWNGIVTVNDITLDGANNTAYSAYGSLYVQTTKNIVVNNVMSVNSAGAGNDGVYLDNTSSTTQASITIKNSIFNGNTYRGATILSDGAVTLNNVTAHFNGNSGIFINNNTDSTASVVSVTKGFFNQNTSDGLFISSNGAVTLNQITASTNFADGVEITNSAATTKQAVTISGFLIASGNAGDGLKIASKGNVTITNLTTDTNGGFGTTINNTASGTDGAAVTINGLNNSTSGNTSGGLRIISRGAVTVNNITADSNTSMGLSINNIASVLPFAVNVKGVNSFFGNSAEGLSIISRGAVNVYNVTATYNGNAADNDGVYIFNAADALKPQNVTLFGMNNISFNANDGLNISTYGIITLNNVNASYNGNTVNDSAGNGVIAINLGTLVKPIILKGTNTFNYNDGNGALILSKGAISISNITASGNGGIGALIVNTGATSPVTITGYGKFDGNTANGLFINSNGAVTTTNLSGFFNDGSGVFITTSGLTKPQAVTLKGNNTFIGNGNSGTDSGLYVAADGNITINNLTASQNYHIGAWLDNFTNWDAPVTNFTTFGSILITGYGNFHNNGNDGIYAKTNGNVTLSYITATQNGDDGIAIWTHGVNSKVNLTCVLATENAWGLWMYNTASVLTIKGLSAGGNTNTNEGLSYVLMIRSRCP